MKTVTFAAALAALLFLAGCAGAPSTIEECPLLGVGAGSPDCYVDYYGGGHDGADAGEGDSESEE